GRAGDLPAPLRQLTGPVQRRQQDLAVRGTGRCPRGVVQLVRTRLGRAIGRCRVPLARGQRAADPEPDGGQRGSTGYRSGHERDPDTPERQEWRSEEHTSELQSRENLVCRLLLENKK